MRLSTQFAIFFIAFNLFAGSMMAMGVHTDLGVNLETGNPQEIQDATQQGQGDVGLGNSEGGTLFGMYSQLTNQIGVIVNVVAPGFAMLKLFLPNALVDPLAAISGVIVAVDVLNYARGVA